MAVSARVFAAAFPGLVYFQPNENQSMTFPHSRGAFYARGAAAATSFRRIYLDLLTRD